MTAQESKMSDKVMHREIWYGSYRAASDHAQRLWATGHRNVEIVHDTDEKGKRAYVLHADEPESKLP